jgi:SAM-dependent methyltransferase
MSLDARDAAGFYETPLGQMTALLLRRILLEIWPNCAGQSLLGLGYTQNFLQLWREQSARSIPVATEQMGCTSWPAGRANLACKAEEDALPFPDMSFDRILVVHGLEQADNARRMLREAWRLLKDDGRMVIIVPNRRGMWAYGENTPFGSGQPYSQGQLARLLQGLFFTVEQQRPALFAPPLQWRANLKMFNALEQAGHFLAPQLAGLNIAEASKDVHAVMPLKRRPARRRVLVDATAP